LNERQMERRKNTCEILLERYRKKSFLHRIVTGDEKWIFFENSQKIMGRPRRTIHIDRKTESLWQENDALCLVGLEVYYELLKPGETVNIKCYQQQLINLNRSLLKKRSEY